VDEDVSEGEVMRFDWNDNDESAEVDGSFNSFPNSSQSDEMDSI